MLDSCEFAQPADPRAATYVRQATTAIFSRQAQLEGMDRLTAAVSETNDFKAAAECYADDAVAVTPDQGEIPGREAIVEYLRQSIDPFPDIRFEYEQKHEAGNVAIDEGLPHRNHTPPLPLPPVRAFRRRKADQGTKL